MATKKKAVKKSTKAEGAAKRKALNEVHKKKAKGTGNPALDRANAVAKKGKKVAPKAAKPKAEKPAAEPKKKADAPQFFGRPKVKKEVDPVKAAAERNALHTSMMRVPWYAEHRAASIELWVARRKAIADGDTAAVEKINRKLDKIGKERDTERSAWKAEGSVIPGEAPAKEPKKAAVKKAKTKKKENARQEQPEPMDLGDYGVLAVGGGEMPEGEDFSDEFTSDDPSDI